ncbi:MAG: DDE-type integrase/transposase/recombinase [Candidatus Thiodiazotropha endolucinida]
MESAAAFDTLCSITDSCVISDIGIERSLRIDHHVYDKLSDSWLKRRSEPQPMLNVVAHVIKEDYAALGFTLDSTRTLSASLPALADTGCQSCLAGLKVIHRLGLRESDLIPVTMQMHTATNIGIKILGATILRLRVHDEGGKMIETRQMTYVTDASDKLFLSREACKELGIISDSFPNIDPEMLENHTQNASIKQHTCACPKREPPPPLPEKLPFPPTKENLPRLKTFLLDHYKSSTFNNCEHQPLPLMAGPPMKLMVDSNAEPVAYHTPIPVPIHWRDTVKAGLDQDVRLGVIEPVPIGEPVTWCHRMVVCAKKNGEPRRTVDLQPLNAHATRETHHTPSPFHQARSVPNGKKKSVLDAWNGYHSVPIREKDRHLTTFITPWGRYRYKTAPQGYIASGDGYTRRYDELVSDVPNKTKCIDDVLLWSDSIEESFFQVANWLDLCGRNGIILNPRKFTFAEDTVEFAGFEITPDTVRPCRRYLQAILDFPTPKNITDVRSWFGLVNQVAYALSMTDKMLTFRCLLQPNTPFQWTPELDILFKESKDAIVHEIEEGVRIFDPKKPTCLTTDWSKDGIGFWLLQKHCNCSKIVPFCCKNGWRVTLVGSRFTHAAESRYAPVEGEALAVADALDKARYFVLGCSNLTVAVDHKPLLKLFGDRSLENISNARLRNLKEKTLRYRFRMIHIPGAKHRATDSISRHPTGNPEKLVLTDDIAHIEQPLADISGQSSILVGLRCQSPDVTVEDSVLMTAVTSLDSLNLRSVTWDRVRTATASDNTLQTLAHLIESGLPDLRNEFPDALQEYYPFRNDLYTVDGVILYKDRVVVPPTLRPEVLASLHSAHQGVTAMTARAESSVFWPGINPAISSLRTSCQQCNRIAPSNPKPPPTPLSYPEYPFQCVCSDYFHFKGHYYLVVVDRYSNWPIVEKASGGAQGLIDCLRRNFVTFGIPDELSSDGGPEFTSALTRNFLQQWGVQHRLSSVAYPHSNCRAEIGVKTVKRLLMDNTNSDGSLDTDSLQRAILQYRNTPDRDTKLSPAMCVFGRPIRDFIPILPGRYQPHMTWRETLMSREEALRKRHMLSGERLAQHTKRLPPLRVGDHVRVQNQIGPHPLKWDRTGTVVEVRQFDQYVIKIDGSGRVTLRNRQFLRKYVPVYPKNCRPMLYKDIHVPLYKQPACAPETLPTVPQLSKVCHSPPKPINQGHQPEEKQINDNYEEPPPSDPPAPAIDMTPSKQPSHAHDQDQRETPDAPQVRRSGRATRKPLWHDDYQM